MTAPLGKVRFALAFLFVILAVNFLAAQAVRPGSGNGDLVPDPHSHNGNPSQTLPAVVGPIGETVVTGNGINYHGGPVLKGNPVRVYMIWYGNWNGTGSNTAATVSLIEHFISTLGEAL